MSDAREDDLPGILAIYNHVIAHTTAVYTETPAPLSDRATWLEARRAGGFPVLVETANGVVQARRGRVARLKVGTIERGDMAVHVSDSFGDTAVLGMNFLSSLSAWGVEGQWLVLTP